MICTTKRLLIKEWIATPQDKLKELSPDDPIIETIFEFLENPDSDLELLKLIVKKLYELYQCEDGRLRLITLSLVPVLMSIYIRIAHNYYYHLPKSEFNSLTVLLIYVYNIEIIDHHSSSSLLSSSSNHLSHSANPTPMPPPSLPPLSSAAAQPMQPPQLIPPIQHKKSHSDNGINLIPGGGGGGGTAVSPGMMAASALAAGRLKTIDIRVVSLSKPSIYHEKNSASVTAAAGTDTLTRINPNHHNQGDTKICIFGPYSEVEELVNSNYLSVFAVLLKVYNNHIAELGRCTLRALCQFYLRLFQQGQLASAAGGGDSDCGAKLASDIKEKIKQFLTTADSDPEMIQLPRNCIRIQFSSEFLVELTRSCHYCIYNDFEELGLELMDEICNYSTYKLYGEVLLLINAMKNSIAINNQRLAELEAIRQKQRTASLVPVMEQQQQNSAIAPLATTITSAISTISNIISNKTHPQSQALNANGVNNRAQQNGSTEFIKSPNSIMSSPNESSITSSGGGFGVGGGRPKMAITNASFKTKKLPDDIPIVIHPSSATNSSKNTTISGNSNKLSGNKKGLAAGASKSASAAQLAQMAKKLDSIDEEKSARMAAAANRTSSSTSKNQKQPLPHHHSLLQQQNSKESSSNSSLASTTSSTAANSTAVAASASAAQKQQPNNKKGVMYLLKEFKRTGNNSNSSNNRDSPLSIANQNGCGISIAVPNIQTNIKPTTVAASTAIANGNADDSNNDNDEELFIDELDSIPLKPLKLIPDKYIDDDDDEDGEDDQDDSKEHVDIGNNNNGVNDVDDDDDDGNYFNNGGDEDNELITEDEPGTGGAGVGGSGNSNQSDQSTSSSKELLPTCTAGSTSTSTATIVASKKITGNNNCSGTTAANNDSSASSSPTMTSTMSPEKKAFLFSKL